MSRGVVMWALVWILVIMAVVEVTFSMVMITIWTLEDWKEWENTMGGHKGK